MIIINESKMVYEEQAQTYAVSRIILWNKFDVSWMETLVRRRPKLPQRLFTGLHSPFRATARNPYRRYTTVFLQITILHEVHSTVRYFLN